MKKIKIIFLLLSIALSPALFGATSVPYQVDVKDVSVRKSGNMVMVDFKIVPNAFPQNYRLTVVPMLFNDKSRSVTMPSTTLVGKKKNMSDKRAGMVPAQRYTLVGRNAKPIQYSVAIPFEDWMQTVSLSVYQFGETCCSQYQSDEKSIASSKELYYNPVPSFDMGKYDYKLSDIEKYALQGQPLPFGTVQRSLLEGTGKDASRVVFRSGSEVIDKNISGNSDVLGSLGEAFDQLLNNPEIRLTHIMIAGYASPEGPLDKNTRLASARAEAIKNYLQSRMDYPSDYLFELYNGRENWNGLRRLVEKSDMPDRDAIISIIDSYSINQEIRKTKLQQFKGGAPYRYMLETLYPQLRSGGYVQVCYETKGTVSVVTAVQGPDGKIRWANSNSSTNRNVAALNNAVDQIDKSDYDGALASLLPIKDDPRTWNNIGALYMMRGDYDKARDFLQRAADKSSQNAVKNLGELDHAERVIEQNTSK